MSFNSYRKISRTDWGVNTSVFTNEQIKFGAVLRIADALEVIAKNNQILTEEVEKYKRWYTAEEEKNQYLRHSISGLRGYIKKVNKINVAEKKVIK